MPAVAAGRLVDAGEADRVAGAGLLVDEDDQGAAGHGVAANELGQLRGEEEAATAVADQRQDERVGLEAVGRFAVRALDDDVTLWDRGLGARLDLETRTTALHLLGIAHGVSSEWQGVGSA